MHTTDQSAPDEHDDHRLVHHFIRATGRRPSADELQAMRRHPRVPRPREPVTPGVLAQAVRREVARLIHRM